MFSRSATTDRKALAHRSVWIAAALVLAAGIGGATYYLSVLTVSRIEVTGSLHAGPDAVIELSGIVQGDTLYRIDTDMIEGRVNLHPWIQQSSVTRLPTGTVAIDVTERRPVVLSVTQSGRPSFYLDREGFPLPVDSVSQYDVPLIRGIARGSGPVTVRDTAMIQLLTVLAGLPPAVDGLLSDVIVRTDGEVDALTVPVHDGRCIRVRLGRGDYDRKMRTLRAFWTQAVAGAPGKRIEWIDLRYRGQVVTKEESTIS